jgi:hypothetical protein
MGMLAWAWDAGVTPQSLVRALGTYGERWSKDVITRRFQRMLADRQDKFDHAAFVKCECSWAMRRGAWRHVMRALRCTAALRHTITLP